MSGGVGPAPVVGGRQRWTVSTRRADVNSVHFAREAFEGAGMTRITAAPAGAGVAWRGRVDLGSTGRDGRRGVLRVPARLAVDRAVA